MPTVDEFKTYGMSDLNELTEEAISQLGDNFKILVLTKDSTINSLSVDVTAIPKRQIIQQETDMILPAPIKAFTLTATAQNSSVLKILASVNSGQTWKAFSIDKWIDVNINNLDEVAANGMTIEILNTITEQSWDSFIGDNLKIRFAYYLDLNQVIDTLQLDSLTYETVPVVNQTPKLNSIKITYDDLTIEGRLKDLERINAINIAKLNFKSNALLQSEKYEMHDMIIDTCDQDEMTTISSSGAGEKVNEALAFSEPAVLGEGKVSEFSLASFIKMKKVEVK